MPHDHIHRTLLLRLEAQRCAAMQRADFARMRELLHPAARDYSNFTLCWRTVAPKASYCVRKNSANFAGPMP